jgi:hypothetical protein
MSIGQCALHRTAASARQSKSPAIRLHLLLSSILLVAATVANDYGMVNIK